MRATETILDIPFDVMEEAELMRTLLAYLDEPHNHIVVTPNPEAVMQARRNPAFKQALLDADLRLPDGIGIVIASRLQARSKPRMPSSPQARTMRTHRMQRTHRMHRMRRLRGVDTTFALLSAAATRIGGLSVYLLGAAPGVADSAKARIEAQYPGVRVVGCHHGFFDVREEQRILDALQKEKPDILIVGTGMPRQELWACAHRHTAAARLTLCVGGTIDILSGNVKLAPAFMRQLGLEWLYRLITMPSRAIRMLDLPRFLIAVLWPPSFCRTAHQKKRKMNRPKEE